MHQATVEKFSHTHTTATDFTANESRTLKVVILTTVTMIIEIAAGSMTGSMALLADGWHMGTHAFALGFSYTAYLLARKLDGSDIFSFGTGKFGVLAGYTSALFLGAAALWMIYESVYRMIHPREIAFSEAIGVTVIGLVVNLSSVLILHGRGGNHGHDHGHDHGHSAGHDHDHNFRAAYLHVLADTLTSILALAALFSGKLFDWTFLDPVMGVVGGLLISRWAWSLIRNTGGILLDKSAGEDICSRIRESVESDNDSRIIDLHAWRIGSSELAAIVSVATAGNRTAQEYQARINPFMDVNHLSVEVHACRPAEESAAADFETPQQ